MNDNMVSKTDPEHVKGLGNNVAPPRFVLFVAVLIAITLVLALWRDVDWGRAFLLGFDIASVVFMVSLVPLLRAHSPHTMREHAAENDANRMFLLALSVVVMLAILAAVAGELTAKGAPNVPIVVGTLTLAWFFANTVFALHYAHEYYLEGSKGGLDFPSYEDDDDPDYWDFLYFAYTCGMAFATSDVNVCSRRMRKIVTIHCIAAFGFNIGVLAFSVNTISGAG